MISVQLTFFLLLSRLCYFEYVYSYMIWSVYFEVSRVKIRFKKVQQRITGKIDRMQCMIAGITLVFDLDLKKFRWLFSIQVELTLVCLIAVNFIDTIIINITPRFIGIQPKREMDERTNEHCALRTKTNRCVQCNPECCHIESKLMSKQTENERKKTTKNVIKKI